MSSANLYDRLSAHFPEDGAQRFAELSDGRHYTYQAVRDVSAKFANALTALGVRPGDRVAAQTPKSAEALMLYLGAVRAGAAFLPLNDAYTPAEVGYFLRDAEPRLLVCAPEAEAALAPVAAEAGARVETLGVYAPRSPTEPEAETAARAGSLAVKAIDAATDFETRSAKPDDLAALLYTSGTTGRSKGAMLSHANLYENAAALADLWRFGPADRLLHILPIHHTHGLFVAVNVSLIAGGALIFLPKFDLDAVFAAMPRATAMMGVPTHYTRLLEDPRLTAEAVRGVRLFVSGSAPLLAETHRRFEARTGRRILERYGMTETGMSASNPYEGERRAGTVGFPLPGVALRIADPTTGAALPPGEIGVVEVKGPNVFGGYWRMPEKTAEEFRADGFFITGDLGRFDEDGYLHIVGRGKDLIISGGLNVYPKEVEAEIDALPGVRESAVIGAPHPDFGEAVTAIVVPEPGADLDEARLISALAERLAKFKRPKRAIFVEALPRNSMGKVQKNALRETYAAVHQRS